MSERRRGLGRGLGALIPAAPKGTEIGAPAVGPGATSPTAMPLLTADRVAATQIAEKVPDPAPVPDHVVAEATGAEKPAAAETVAGAHFAELPLDSITPNPRQPREVFDEDALAELVTSIREVGLLQPVVVRQLGPERYELIMGERRWRACREAGLEKIPAIVRATEDEKLLLDALLENLHRAQLNPLEEAAAYDQLLKDFSCTHDELADRIGRSRSQVSNTLRLLKLSPEVQLRLASGVLSAGHGRALLSVDDAQEQEKLARRIVAEGLSVRSVEEIVQLMGSRTKKSSRAKGPRAGARVSPALSDLASRLSDRFDTRVKVDLGQKKGKIVVEFASIEDLERILGALAPGEGGVLEQKLSEDASDEAASDESKDQ
ncbi:ParB/RepB/Spo0J family partition protein [Streptomyces sp. AV19]|uniref:ParB/RepB/Spo0J family partition protein n=1 Tax=Streptomyces sp. AV19 TaxID=2793068 RepID=UPI0018FEFFB9|nr:ParB/RepB/Spo0J family partition protein [Streptomyces sp. AV19]MBH1934741.1 ParB/RepB/Spo0J family partition protein [Streptomyces sp. AV19]MDG4530720.1 ParB/RepB/Spo0J family partition protein [Streptomyces sp. AV19]